MEDFGYQRDEGPTSGSQLMKKIFLAGATLFSLACFVYVTINAYYFVYSDKNGDIETIKSPEGPIKVVEEDAVTGNSMQIDRSIYEDIFGNKKEAMRQVNPKIQNAPSPALPPKQIEKPKVVVESAPVSETKPAVPAKEQKIVVYDAAKQQTPSKDLLTKTDGEDRMKAAAKPLPDKKRAVRVQVAAMTSKEAAQENWGKLSRLYPSLFSGLRSYTERVDLGKRGIFFRLQIGDFYNQVEAEEFCNRYVAQAKKSRADCIVVE